MAPSRRTLLGSLTLVVAGVAGCVSDEGTGTDDSPPTTTAESAETSTPIETLVASTPSETPETQSGIGTGANPIDLEADNWSETKRTVQVTVQKREAPSPLLDESVTLNPNENRRWDLFDGSETGVYDLTARLDDGTESVDEWDFEELSADGWFTVYIEEDGSLSWSYAVA